MKRHVKSSFGYYDSDWVDPDDDGWELEYDYVVVEIPFSEINVDRTGECDYEELIDNITSRPSVTNTTELSDRDIVESIIDPVVDYVDEVISDARSEKIGIKGNVIAEVSYYVSTKPSAKGYIDPDSYEETGEYDFEELQIVRHID